jgi:hypothetical protein
LAKQLIKKGVRMNMVVSDPLWTPLPPSGKQTQEKVEEFGANGAFGRPEQPVEFAPVYVLLACCRFADCLAALSPHTR